VTSLLAFTALSSLESMEGAGLFLACHGMGDEVPELPLMKDCWYDLMMRSRSSRFASLSFWLAAR